MDDYELFKELGFIVKGYNLVNQYSLVNGALVDEGRVKDTDIELVFSSK